MSCPPSSCWPLYERSPRDEVGGDGPGTQRLRRFPLGTGARPWGAGRLRQAASPAPAPDTVVVGHLGAGAGTAGGEGRSAWAWHARVRVAGLSGWLMGDGRLRRDPARGVRETRSRPAVSGRAAHRRLPRHRGRAEVSRLGARTSAGGSALCVTGAGAATAGCQATVRDQRRRLTLELHLE